MNLEVKRLKVEIIRVQAARAEMELKIEERLEDIRRLKEEIEKQDARVLKIQEQLTSMEAK